MALVQALPLELPVVIPASARSVLARVVAAVQGKQRPLRRILLLAVRAVFPVRVMLLPLVMPVEAEAQTIRLTAIQ